VTVTESQRCDRSHVMVTSWSRHTHIVTSHGHSMCQRSQLTGMRTVGGKVHSHNSNCIYSVAESNGDSIEFSLSNAEQRDSWLNSGHRTLAADTIPVPTPVFQTPPVANRNPINNQLAEALQQLSENLNRGSAPKPHQLKARIPDIFDGSDPHKLNHFLFQC